MRHRSKVSNIDLVGMALAASGTHGNEQRAGLSRPLRHSSFGMDLIASIQHTMYIRRQNCRPIARLDKIFDAMHLASRIDQRDAFAHGLHFGLT